MTDLVRHALGFLPWIAVAVLLGVEAAGRLRPMSARDRARNVGRYSLVVCGLSALAAVAGVLAVRQVPVIQAQVLGQSGILDMDLDRSVSVLRAWGRGYYRTSVHPLVCLLGQPWALVVARLTGVADFRAAQLTGVLSLAASAGILGATVLAATRRLGAAALTGALYVSSFAFLLLSGLPESASLAAPTVALPALLLAMHSDREATARERVLWVLAGVLALGVTVTNVFVAGIFHAARHRSLAPSGTRRMRAIASQWALVAAVAAALALAQAALYPGSALWFAPTSVLEEGSFVRWDPGPAKVLSVALQVLGYPLVGPGFVVTETLARRGLPSPYLSAQEAPLGALSAPALALLALAAAGWAWAILRAKRDRLAAASLLAVAFHLLLHLVYGSEFLIYSGNWAVLATLALGLAVATTARPLRLMAAVFVALAAVHNAGSLSELHDLAREHGTRAALHAPLGMPGTHELARSFVAWTGSYSPGIGACGVHLAVWDPDSGETNWSGLVRGFPEDAHRLADGWKPIVSIRSRAGRLEIEQETAADAAGVYTRLRISGERTGPTARARVLALVRGAGAAGSGASRRYERADGARAISADGIPALRFEREPDRVEIVADDRGIASLMAGGELASAKGALSRLRDLVRGALGRSDAAKPMAALAWWDVDVPAGRPVEMWFSSPLAIPPRAGGGQDLARAGRLPPYEPPGDAAPPQGPADARARTRGIEAFWDSRFDSLALDLPDPAWAEATLAAGAHLALAVQQGGRIPVAPVNYGPFARDAAYMVDGLLVTGQWSCARAALDYLFEHPWAGRPHPEGDAPGHLLRAAGRYVRFSRDAEWLRRRASDIRGLAEAIESMRSRGEGAAEADLLGERRRIEAGPAAAALRARFAPAPLPRVNWGTMDGNGALYVNFVSIAGLESAVDLLCAAGDASGAEVARRSLEDLAFHVSALMNAVGYDFGWDERGECAALWPARFDRLDSGAASYFLASPLPGRERPGSPWPYLEIDAAHNRLVAGNRDEGWRVARRFLEDANFRRWRVLDEGGGSDPGYWPALATSPPWWGGVASPHGWSLASLLLLLRDCLVHEDAGQIRLLAGIPPDWLAPGKSWRVRLPTEFGPLDLRVEADAAGVRVRAGDACRPPRGFRVLLPEGFEAAELYSGSGPFALTSRRASR